MSDEDLENTEEPINLPDDLAQKVGRLVDEHYAKKDQEDAWELIRASFHLLPMELQDLYQDVNQLYHAGKFEEASKLFEQWINEAKDMGLI